MKVKIYSHDSYRNRNQRADSLNVFCKNFHKHEFIFVFCRLGVVA